MRAVVCPKPRDPAACSPNDYTRLTSDKLDAQVRSRGLSAKLASTDRSYVAASARLQVLAEVQAKYDFFSARLAAAKRDYAALSDAYEEAVIETTAGQPSCTCRPKRRRWPHRFRRSRSTMSVRLGR